MSNSGAETAPSAPIEEAGRLPAGADPEVIGAFLHWLYRQPVRNLLPLHRQAEQRLKRSGADQDRLNLALLLTVPGASFQDDDRARRLLATVADGKSPLAGIARIHWVHLSYRRELNRQWQGRLDKETQRRQTLEQQLEELKSIEKTLDRRDSGAD